MSNTNWARPTKEFLKLIEPGQSALFYPQGDNYEILNMRDSTLSQRRMMLFDPVSFEVSKVFRITRRATDD